MHGKTVVQDIHQLVTQLGFKTIFLVGHDIGTVVAYPYASCTSYGSKEVSSHRIPNSRFLSSSEDLQHGISIFQQTPDVPEARVQGKEMTYLSWFFHNLPFNPGCDNEDSDQRIC